MTSHATTTLALGIGDGVIQKMTSRTTNVIDKPYRDSDVIDPYWVLKVRGLFFFRPKRAFLTAAIAKYLCDCDRH